MKTIKPLLVALLFLGGILVHAQENYCEKRIYLFDVTGSMRGRGSVKTEDIFSQLKDSLITTLSHIEDPETEIVIVPYTNRCFAPIQGKISQRDSLIALVKNISIRNGDTNIVGAWTYGKNLLDPDKDKFNFMFLLTDGIHNCGAPRQTLYEQMEEWLTFSAEERFFAFYVAFTENAYESGIRSIAERPHDHLWCIKSMDIDFALFKTSLCHRASVNEDNTIYIPFHTNNSQVKPEYVGLDVTMSENPYYEIEGTGKTCIDGVLQFKVREKLPRQQMPLTTTVGLVFSHDEDRYPLVFNTPEEVTLEIVNQGPAMAFVSEKSFGKASVKHIDFGKAMFREPFLGVFARMRKYLEPTLDYPPYKWCIERDTAVLSTKLYVSFNDEAVRSGATLAIDEYESFTQGYPDIEVFLPAVDSSSELLLPIHLKVLPKSKSGKFGGKIFLKTDGLDFVNGNDVKDNSVMLCSWKLNYKQKGTPLLWLLWILTALLAILLIVLLLIFLIRKASKRSKSKDVDRKRLKRRTGWSDAIVNSIRSEEEAEIYIKAGLVEANVGGRPALIRRDIDWKDYSCRHEWLRKKFAEYEKWQDYNNADLIGEGWPPRDKNGDEYQLHHIGQRQDSPFAELTYEEHMGGGNNTILHEMGKESEIDRQQFKKEAGEYWMNRYNLFTKEELTEIYR